MVELAPEAMAVSYETTIANAKARAAEHEWKWHRQGCPVCTAAARARKREAMCDPGLALYDKHRTAQAELAENRRADKAPVPGQQAML
jgi:hypothetical protein